MYTCDITLHASGVATDSPDANVWNQYETMAGYPARLHDLTQMPLEIEA